MKSYNAEKNMFPNIVMPLSVEELSWVAKAGNMHLRERFVPKSEMTTQLQAELEQAQDLLGKATRLAAFWDDKSLRLPELTYRPRGYADRDPHWRYTVQRNLSDVEEKANRYVNTIQSSLHNICATMESAISELQQALQMEAKGNAGEERVESYLAGTLHCRILSGVVLPGVQEQPDSPKTAETDLLVFARNGVYVCEIKNYGKAGQSLEVQEDGHILKLDHNGYVLEDMGSPFEQNERHCQAVRQVLDGCGLSDVPIFSAVIIGNTDVRISNKSSLWAGDMYSFRDLVYSMIDASVLPNEQVIAAYDAVKGSRMGERKFPMPAVTPLMEDLDVAFARIRCAEKEHNQWVSHTEDAVNQWVRNARKEWAAGNPKRYMYARLMDGLDGIKAFSSLWSFIAMVVFIVMGIFGDYIPEGIGILGFVLVMGTILVWRALKSIFFKDNAHVFGAEPKTIVGAILHVAFHYLLMVVLPSCILLLLCYCGIW